MSMVHDKIVNGNKLKQKETIHVTNVMNLLMKNGKLWYTGRRGIHPQLEHASFFFKEYEVSEMSAGLNMIKKKLMAQKVLLNLYVVCAKRNL